MRIRIRSEGGTWVILDCTSEITDRMTGTELVKYVLRFVGMYCPGEGTPDHVKIMVEIAE